MRGYLSNMHKNGEPNHVVGVPEFGPRIEVGDIVQQYDELDPKLKLGSKDYEPTGLHYRVVAIDHEAWTINLEHVMNFPYLYEPTKKLNHGDQVNGFGRLEFNLFEHRKKMEAYEAHKAQEEAAQ